MGHHVVALIGSRQALARLMEQFGPPASTQLPYDLVILPLGELRLELLKEHPANVYQGFTHLSAELEAGLLEGIGTASALYIETDYFGGVGTQGAAFFHDGKLVWRETAASDDKPSITPISRGLAELGVPRTLGGDEFQSVGLERFRSNEALGLYEWEDED